MFSYLFRECIGSFTFHISTAAVVAADENEMRQMIFWSILNHAPKRKQISRVLIACPSTQREGNLFLVSNFFSVHTYFVFVCDRFFFHGNSVEAIEGDRLQEDEKRVHT
jgi:hypothetical protein